MVIELVEIGVRGEVLLRFKVQSSKFNWPAAWQQVCFFERLKIHYYPKLTSVSKCSAPLYWRGVGGEVLLRFKV
jgi:hypothetical protein